MAVDVRAIAALLCLASCTSVQQEGVALNGMTTARSGDLAAIDAAIDGVYAVISGPVGQQRDFARMRSLFMPDARLSSMTASGIRGGTLEDYIARSGPGLVSSGFTERELDRRVEIYGDIAHAWSSYEGSFTQGDGTRGTVRGINSFQLARQDGRWLVQSIFWQAESPEFPLPQDMDGE
ncbi:hypothetical protein [Qipengyuania sp. MTN3-11]|uniref:hypothetical protein n=1 Tax=Qipengyuania sp. MTN3-11 TaxID=3056557 RepID=UPI0036F39825